MIEVQPEQIEGQEDPNVGDGNHENHRQRLLDGIEQDARREENDDNDQSQAPILTVITLRPTPVAPLRLGGITHRHEAIESAYLPLLNLAPL